MEPHEDIDWFEKNEDDLVKDLKSKTALDDRNTTEHITVPCEKGLDRRIVSDCSASSSPTKKLAISKLRELTKMEVVDAFLFVATAESDLFDSKQIAPNDSVERVVLYVRAIVRMIELELPGYHVSMVKSLANNLSLMENLCEISRKFFERRYKALWLCESKMDDIIHGMDILFQSVEHEQMVTDICYNAMKAIRKIIEKSDMLAITKHSTCQNLIKTLNRILESQSEHGVQLKGCKEKEIYPTLNELTASDQTDEAAANTCKNWLLTKDYKDVVEYMTVQKHLLREDFIISLREFVNAIKITVPPNSLFYEDVYIIMNQQFLEAHRSQMLCVDIMGSQRKSQAVSKKGSQTRLFNLKSGALLCFTTSLEFENLILATVTAVTPNLLRSGYIFINIVRQYNIGSIYKRSLIMFESPAFFEPYKNVFNVLRSFNDFDIPMQKYILGKEINSASEPAYLRRNSVYTYKHTERFQPLDEVPKQLQLNHPQKLAFKDALTKEFCIIQGPPGTGKTRLAVEILNTLKGNARCLGPILLIAYTNESLDKCLSKLCDVGGIVRLGTRSKCPEIAKFILDDSEVEVNPLLKRLYYFTDLQYKNEFSILQKLYHDFDGTEESYQLIVKAQKDLQEILEKLNTIHILFKYYAVKDKQILAMTTTYAARINYVFKLLKTPIVIFEEAAEILESHVIACLTRYTQHIIMIGDHMQLQPYCSSYQHSRVHDLNISLFERLIKRNITYTKLQIQYRMRPEIAALICPAIYKQLENAEVVCAYKSVKGMKSNLFFVTHEEPENEDEYQISKYNPFECQKLIQLATHLICTADSTVKIVVLSPYLRQVELITKMFQQKPSLRKIDVTTVDSFQGMEADIVLLSLVRSNKNKDIGFLRERNRVCVALSRAKIGLYIIGNMKLLTGCSKIWQDIEKVLNIQKSIGSELPCK